MSSHHPSRELLEKFAGAGLDGAIASVVSAHVEHCSICRISLKRSEGSLSVEALDAAVELSSVEQSTAWQNISKRLAAGRSSAAAPNPAPLSLEQNEIHIDGLRFELPRALHKLTDKPLKWMPFGRGGKICKLGDEKQRSLFLIYLASHEAVPLHSHAGAEHSYVVSGNYSADGHTFETGDFSCSTKDVVHAPKAGSADGCLLLSSVERRLNFLHGWLKPFNGLLWWVLNLRAKFATESEPMGTAHHRSQRHETGGPSNGRSD